MVVINQSPNGGQMGDRLRNLFNRATSLLNKSKEMYTHGRGYYDMIGNMYYLYDDFSDRQVHYHHAFQVAGTEIATVMHSALFGWHKKRFHGLDTEASGTEPGGGAASG